MPLASAVGLKEPHVACNCNCIFLCDSRSERENAHLNGEDMKWECIFILPFFNPGSPTPDSSVYFFLYSIFSLSPLTPQHHLPTLDADRWALPPLGPEGDVHITSKHAGGDHSSVLWQAWLRWNHHSAFQIAGSLASPIQCQALHPPQSIFSQE